MKGCGEESAGAATRPDNASSGNLILHEICAAGDDDFLIAINGCTAAVVSHAVWHAAQRCHVA